MFVVLSSEHFSQFPLQIVFSKENLEVIHIDICKNCWIAHVHIRGMHNVQHIHKGTLYGGGGKWVDLWKWNHFIIILHPRQFQSPGVNVFVTSFCNATHVSGTNIMMCQQSGNPMPIHRFLRMQQPNTLTSPSISFMLTLCSFFHRKCQEWQFSHLTCPPNQRGQTVCGVISVSHTCRQMPSTYDTACTIASLTCRHAREML